MSEHDTGWDRVEPPEDHYEAPPEVVIWPGGCRVERKPKP